MQPFRTNSRELSAREFCRGFDSVESITVAELRAIAPKLTLWQRFRAWLRQEV
jgi:hypothetical protein